MIPILFESSATTFTSNGLGRLTEAISPLVREGRNGIYELSMNYPVTGRLYDSIGLGSIIVSSHDEAGDLQPFVVYQITRPINGIVTILAHHISYKLNNVILKPFTAASAALAVSKFETEVMTDQPFSFWTDVSTAGTFKLEVPASARAMMGGTKGSLLDVYGGEYEYDKFLVKLHAHRGTDSGVAIRYGKNLVDLSAVTDAMDVYNAVVPYWRDTEGNVVYGGVVTGAGGIAKSAYWTNESSVQITDENATPIEFRYFGQQVVTMDLSEEFDEAPSVNDLEARAQRILDSNRPWIPDENIKIDFVALWQTEEYASIAPLERVKLCDTVTVLYPALGVSVKAQVITTEWNPITERYELMELGKAKSNFADVLMADAQEAIAQLPTISMMDAAISAATSRITGGMGGHIVFMYDADGKPTDMLVMDTEDVNTALHVLRINVNGIGFSSTGISGPYTSAWTLGGAFNANFITAGYIVANMIHGGTLTMGGPGNGNGIIRVLDGSGNEIGLWDNSGLSATGAFTMAAYNYRLNTGNYRTWAYTRVMGLFQRTLPCLMFQRTNSSGDVLWTRSWQIIGNTFEDVVVSTSTSYARVIGIVAPESGKTKIDGTLDTHDFTYFTEEFGCDDDGGNQFYQLFARNYIGPDDSFDVYYSKYRVRVGAADSNYTRFDLNYNKNTINVRAGTARIDISDTSERINGVQIAFGSSSTRRYKHDIRNIEDDILNPERLYDLPVRQGVYNDGVPLQYWDMAGETIPMFIAEEVAEIYPSAAIRSKETKQIESWDERRIIPPMLKLIQDQKRKIDEQEERIARLEGQS